MSDHALGTYVSVLVLCGLLGVMWLGWVVVLALVVARMVARIVQRPEAPAEPIQAQVLGGPLDGLEFELHV